MNITENNLAEINFAKSPDSLIPAIVQDARTRVVLMQGYVNLASMERTFATGKVTFYSRSKQRLWTKGESSGNFLELDHVLLDCDRDSLLIMANPRGPVCHTGTDTCWGLDNEDDFLYELDSLIQKRRSGPLDPDSYTSRLLHRGINKIAQKVGEEAVELVIEAKDDNTELFLNEAADLMYHYLVLLAAKGHSLREVTEVLRTRNGK